MTTTRGVRWGAAGALLLVLAAGAPSQAETSPAPPPAGYSATGTWQLLAEVNSYRRSRGLRPLTVDTKLAAAARAWAERMASSGRLAHNDGLFTTASRQRLGMRALGENVGFNMTVPAQHKAFLASSGHRANIVYASFRVAGFAVVRDKRGYLWSVQDFGTPRA